MTPRLWTGLTLTLAAGLLAGNCMLPMKFARRWPWEGVWFMFSIVSLAILPWALALTLVSHLFSVYASLPASAFVAPVLFGAGWGIAQILFGLSVARLGMALGYAIIVGLGALLGTLIPLLVKHADIAASERGTPLFAGIAVMILGVATVSWAGRKREGRDRSGENEANNSYTAALGLAILCGLLAPMLNYAFAFGEAIGNQAVLFGNSHEAASYAIWPVALLGGLVPNVGYAVFLLVRNKNWHSLGNSWNTDAWCGVAMGVLWMGAMAVYGLSSVYLGALGTSAGWALFQIFMIMTANGSGLLTAEWKGAPVAAKFGMAAGLALLCGATALIAPRG
jgi:L-rhamnose-H+ transport protein